MDASATNCWAPGAELLLTPDDIANPAAAEVATIASVDGDVLTLANPIGKKLTAVGDGYGEMVAVEVALLTRRVIFEPEPNTDMTTGGHTIIMHTPHVAQNIKGVEFRRFGQAGNVGRYPLHFRKFV